MQPERALLFCGLLAPSAANLDHAVVHLIQHYGLVRERSSILPWDYTAYYQKEMGKPLVRQFVFFEETMLPDRIVSIKRKTIGIEKTLSVSRGEKTYRTVNIDPGYVTPAKVVLATTKDFAHRIYLSDGIYGDVTLVFRKNSFTPHPHTYPDFRTKDYITLFNKVRNWVLRNKMKSK